MLFADLGGFVGMAVGASVSGIVLDMAVLAADLAFFAVIEREGVLG